MIKYLAVVFLLFELADGLEVGFYSKSCPAAESVIRGVVQRRVAINRGNAAILLRLHFHDCFVEGCDGSILIKSIENDDESFAAGNAGVQGFKIIDEAKAAVEQSCPGVVSCADIIAIAARDAVVMAKGPFYEVPTGRKDGRVSNIKNAESLPDPQDSIETLKSKFRDQGLTDRDLVLLSAGAHTIGLTACFFVTRRLDTGDPTINPQFFQTLRSKCPRDGDVSVKIPLDWDGEFHFDSHIFQNIKNGRGVIASDSVLYHDPTTKAIIDAYLIKNGSFNADFAGAMIKMGSIRVKTGIEGETRRICNATN